MYLFFHGTGTGESLIGIAETHVPQEQPPKRETPWFACRQPQKVAGVPSPKAGGSAPFTKRSLPKTPRNSRQTQQLFQVPSAIWSSCCIALRRGCGGFCIFCCFGQPVSTFLQAPLLGCLKRETKRKTTVLGIPHVETVVLGQSQDPGLELYPFFCLRMSFVPFQKQKGTHPVAHCKPSSQGEVHVCGKGLYPLTCCPSSCAVEPSQKMSISCKPTKSPVANTCETTLNCLSSVPRVVQCFVGTWVILLWIPAQLYWWTVELARKLPTALELELPTKKSHLFYLGVKTTQVSNHGQTSPSYPSCMNG